MTAGGNGMDRYPHLKRVLCWLLGSVLTFLLVLNPIATAVVYEVIFGNRYETASWASFRVEDFEDLQVKRNDFTSGNGTVLAGFCYSKDDKPFKGVMILSHGLGGGGHNGYMTLIDYFASVGYAVFAYDATGNDQSGGDGVRGLPQGLIDLDHAIDHVQQIEAYQGLPIVLFGHSWGAYSVGNVLSFHPEVKAAVMVSGFNESEDMLRSVAGEYVGSLAAFEMPYLELYELLKFGGEYADASAVEGIRNSNAQILIVQSADDTTVPMECGYVDLYAAFGNSERVRFRLYENRGHNYLFYSEASYAYREQLNKDYDAYVQSHGGVYNDQIKEEFMDANLDKKQCYEPDPELMAQILGIYDSVCE
jgi:pimeloyl-ACP methyl ester carboxylesterase